MTVAMLMAKVGTYPLGLKTDILKKMYFPLWHTSIFDVNDSL